MLIHKIIYVTAVIFILWFFVSQILIPMFKGIKLFPLFNEKRNKLAEQIVEAKTEAELINDIKKDLN